MFAAGATAHLRFDTQLCPLCQVRSGSTPCQQHADCRLLSCLYIAHTAKSPARSQCQSCAQVHAAIGICAATPSRHPRLALFIKSASQTYRGRHQPFVRKVVA